MHRLTVAPTKNHFLDNGKPFFLLADTVWSAFTNIAMDDWTAYLDIRRDQGFNALQINILPQWDRSTPDLGYRPFCLNAQGTYDFGRIDADYFVHAGEMLERAVERGFVPVLVVLWSNYVEGTFFDGLEGRCAIPLCHVENYAVYAASAFARFRPVYLISGDTNFSEKSAACYGMALAAVKRTDPEALASLHLCGGRIDGPDPDPVAIPESLMESGLLDFITYQSSHFFDYHRRAMTYAEFFLRHPIRRPLINAEPCYEGWESGSRRFGRAEVRQTVWLSLLSGASSGVAFGSQGLWQWYRRGSVFPPQLNDGRRRLYSCLEPPEWGEALRAPAAWDAGFAKAVFVSMGLFGLSPLPLPTDSSSFIRAAVAGDGEKIIVYLPFSLEIFLPVAAEAYEWLLVDLEERRWGVPGAEDAGRGRAGAETKLKGRHASDALIIGLRKSFGLRS